MLGNCQNAADTNWQPNQAPDRSLQNGSVSRGLHTARRHAFGDPIVDFRFELRCCVDHSYRLSDRSENIKAFFCWTELRKNPIDSTMDAIRKLIREKAEERDFSLSWLSRQIGRNAGYLFDFLEKGTPRALPERERGILADRLGISEDYLRPRDRGDDMGVMSTVEGERIDIESIRDTRLRETLRREVKAAKAGEVWCLRTPLIEAKYPPGTYVVVDAGMRAYENDYVLAEVSSGREKSHIFRLYLPPNLVAAVISAPSVRGVTVDRERVVIRGVIRGGFL
jgi:hypothetical protein